MLRILQGALPLPPTADLQAPTVRPRSIRPQTRSRSTLTRVIGEEAVADEKTVERNPPQSAALAAGLRPCGACRREAKTRGAHAALRVVGSCDSAVGRPPESRYRIRGG